MDDRIEGGLGLALPTNNTHTAINFEGGERVVRRLPYVD